MGEDLRSNYSGFNPSIFNRLLLRNKNIASVDIPILPTIDTITKIITTGDSGELFPLSFSRTSGSTAR